MITFDREEYFNYVRGSLFQGKLTQRQVDGQEFILSAWEELVSPQELYNDVRWLAYFLATAKHETASEMWPIEEYGKGEGMEYGKRDPETGQTYYGRGFVQLTWRDNYKRADTEFGWEGDDSCEWHAELQLDPDIAAKTGFRGMVNGWFRSGHYFNRYFNDTIDDVYGAREIINGDKHIVPSWSNGVSIGNLVKEYYEDFMQALTKSTVEVEPEPASEPIEQVVTVNIDVPDGVDVVVIVNGEQIVT